MRGVGVLDWGPDNAFYVNPAVNEAFAMGPHIEQLIADAETVKDSINAASAVGDDFLMGMPARTRLKLLKTTLWIRSGFWKLFQQVGNAP